MAENEKDRVSAKPTGKRQLTGESTVSSETYAKKKGSVAKVDAADDDNLGGGPVQFVPEVATEMRKVVWPTSSQMVNYTIIVFIFLILMTALVWGVDTGAAWVVEKIFVPNSETVPTVPVDPGLPVPDQPIEIPEGGDMPAPEGGVAPPAGDPLAPEGAEQPAQ